MIIKDFQGCNRCGFGEDFYPTNSVEAPTTPTFYDSSPTPSGGSGSTTPPSASGGEPSTQDYMKWGKETVNMVKTFTDGGSGGSNAPADLSKLALSQIGIFQSRCLGDKACIGQVSSVMARVVKARRLYFTDAEVVEIGNAIQAMTVRRAAGISPGTPGTTPKPAAVGGGAAAAGLAALAFLLLR